jgi:hypothetical protein
MAAGAAMSRDPIAEFLPWTPLGSYGVTQWLEAQGLPADVDRLADAIYGRPGPFGDVEYGSIELVLGAAPVLPVGDRLFEFADDGPWMALQPVEDASGGVVDVIAWDPAEPDHSRLLTGDGEALGLIELELVREGEAIMVYATPHSWLRAGGRGLCLLTHDWVVAQRILIGERELAAETIELGDRLERMLSYRPSPAIFVPSLECAT